MTAHYGMGIVVGGGQEQDMKLGLYGSFLLIIIVHDANPSS
jgi:hypothetical protein